MPYSVKVNPNFKASLRKRELSLVRYAARVAVGEVSRLMYESPATGHWYPSRTGEGWHQASAPGEPPAPDTKGLVRSIGASVKETATGAESVVGSNYENGTPIWRFLEFGTSRMRPRPSARPAFLVAVDKLRQALKGGQPGTDVSAQFGPEVR